VRYDVVTFDCYGTLIDWEAGITQAFRDAIEGHPVEDRAILEAHREIEPALESGEYRSYRAVLTACASEMAARLGIPLPLSRAGLLADSIGTWPPFPDTVPALRRLAAAGYELGILSNIDHDLLARTRELLEVPFALIVTAEDVSSYKPAHGHFLEARRRIGRRAWLHAAQSRYHDIAPARELGIDAAWVRRREREGEAPAGVHVFDDLAGLADWL
jgi:2-haloacid dehalogenase